MEQKKQRKNNTSVQEPKTTGHEWDGIQEYDNPDPFWLRGLFYAMLFWSIVYWIIYPAFPGQRDEGALGWTSYKEMSEGVVEMQKLRDKYLADFNKASFDQILADQQLLKFALTGGRSAFNNNCAVCHGAGGAGNPGYPNLAAGAWLWGGKPDDIYTTIKHGIRSDHEEARDSQMAAFGRDGMLTKPQIEMLVDFVIGLHEGKNYSDEANKLFQVNCASCHGDKGQGNRGVGAPALNDAIWLYGNDRDTVFDVIYNGRQGVMPYWTGKLDDATIRQLVIYVHQLGGGE